MMLATAGKVVGHMEKQAAADAQNKAARDNLMQQYTQSGIKTLQEHTAASDQLFNDNLKAREAQASYYASTETMGGSIVGRIMRDKRAVQARNKHNIDTNYEYKIQQTQYELEGLRVQADGRMKTGPSILATGLGIANDYQTIGDGQYETTEY
jgi:hypothetical protein